MELKFFNLGMKILFNFCFDVEAKMWAVFSTTQKTINGKHIWVNKGKKISAILGINKLWFVELLNKRLNCLYPHQALKKYKNTPVLFLSVYFFWIGWILVLFNFLLPLLSSGGSFTKEHVIHLPAVFCLFSDDTLFYVIERLVK